MKPTKTATTATVTTAAKSPSRTSIPLATLAGRRLSFADVEFSNLGGQGPDIAGASSGRRGIRYRNVTQVDGREVDLVLDAIGGYSPAADVGANGGRGSLGRVAFSCGTGADLGLGFFEAGTSRAASVPDLRLSFVHVRLSGAPRRGDVALRGPSLWYLSTSTQVDYAMRHSFVHFESLGAEDAASARSVEELTAAQRSRAVTAVFRQTSSVRFSFQSHGPVEEGCAHALLLGGPLADPDFQALF